MSLPEGTVAVITTRRAGPKGEPIRKPASESPLILPNSILSAAQGFLSFGAEEADNAGQVAPFRQEVVTLGKDFDLARFQREARVVLKEALPELSRMGEPARVIDTIIDYLAMESLRAQEAAELKRAS